MKTCRILILEDDLATVSLLVSKLAELEEELLSKTSPAEIAVMVLSAYTQVAQWINKGIFEFDVVLLDRDCKAAGSFYVLDFDMIGVDKIFAISSVPEHN